MNTSLRTLWKVMLAAATLVVAAAAVPLIVITTLQHRTTRGAVDAVESLLLLDRMHSVLSSSSFDTSASGRALAERDLKDLLQVAAERHAVDPEGRSVVQRVQRHLDDYFGALPGTAARPAEASAKLPQTFAAMTELAEYIGRQAKMLESRAAQWDRTGDLIGYSAIALVALLGGLLLVLSRPIFRPALELARAMRRFGGGQHDARAPVEGPKEFRALAVGFNEMAEALEKETERRLAFLGGVAHDLRNPLAALRLATAAIQPDQPLPSEERIRQAFARTDRQIVRLERMIYDFLDSARVESGQLELRPEDLDLRELVEQVVKLFEPGSRTHRLRIELPDQPAQVHADSLRLEQVLINLVSNAIKYSPRGGDVTVSVRIHTDHVVMAVTDQGLGLARREIADIFMPFRRTGASRESIPGVGLGLYVARRIVEGHGGVIEVDSTPGEGSTFRVRLPRRIEAAAAPGLHRPQPVPT